MHSWTDNAGPEVYNAFYFCFVRWNSFAPERPFTSSVNGFSLYLFPVRAALLVNVTSGMISRLRLDKKVYIYIGAKSLKKM